MILTSKNIHLSSGSNVHFDKCSINLSSSMNFYVISDVAINDLQCTLSDNSVFSLYSIVDGRIVIANAIDNSNVELIHISGKYVYKINVLFLSTEAGNFSSKLNVSYGFTIETITMLAFAEEIDQNLLIVLQNFKQYISEDYMTAFRESVENSKEIDNSLYNRKMREMLLNIFDITAMHSSYKNLLTTLSFFGYGDLLTIKEYWSSNGQYKSTNIGNAVLSRIEEHLIGFDKTNQMSLVYQINEQSGIDDDGLPIYINIFDDTDKILSKLYTLERLLNSELLHINTHIVDIVGEFQSSVAIEMNTVLNDAKIENIQLTDNLSASVNYSFTNEKVFIERHNVIVESLIFEEIDSVLTIIPGMSSASTIDMFHIVKIANDFEEFDLLTKFYSGDFGLFELNLELDKTRYQSYRYLIKNDDTGDVEFTSIVYNIDNLTTNSILTGIKTIGRFKIILYLIDWYGGSTIVSLDSVLEVASRPVDIFIGKYDIDGQIDKDLQLYTTFKDTTGQSSNFVIDATENSIDINTWNAEINNPIALIARMYESDFDQYVSYTNVNQLNSIPLVQLSGLPLHTWGHFYGICIYDVLGDLSTGTKTLGLRNFAHLPYDEISLYYDSAVDTPDKWITRFVALINSFCLSNEFSTFNDFTWDLHWFSNDHLASTADTRPMLRAKSKLAAYSTKNVDITLDTIANSDFAETYLLNDLKIFSRVDANMQFTVIQPSTSMLQFTIGNFTHSSSRTVTSSSDLYTILDSLIPTDIKHEVSISLHPENNSIMIYSKWDIAITHGSINGMHSDIARGLDSSKIMKLDLGADIKRGEPFFAFIDLEKRIDLGDVTWTLKNALTNKIVTVQHAWSFRWIVTDVGSYSLTLTCTDKSGTITTTRHGCIVVTNI